MPQLPWYFVAPPSSGQLYVGSYDPVLVALSLAVVVFASYAALLVAHQVSATKQARRRRTWLALGGLCMGMGIWAMHFVGMLAFSLPCTTSYEPGLTLLSTIPAILASAMAIDTISRPTTTLRNIFTGGLLIAAGVGLMHYSGMAAMRLPGVIRYDATVFALSLLVAMVLGTLALWINHRLARHSARRAAGRGPDPHIIGATLMGLAVAGMHYTAMSAAYFVRGEDTAGLTAGLAPSFLAAIVLATAALIVVIVLAASYVSAGNLTRAWRGYGVVSALLACWLAGAWVSAEQYYRRLGEELFEHEQQHAAQEATQLAHNLESSFRMLKGVVQLLAHDDDTVTILRDFARDSALHNIPLEARQPRWLHDRKLQAANAELRAAARNVGVDNLFILNAAGDCIAAANADQPDTPVGFPFADREYFLLARDGLPGQQFAVGRTTNVPGLYFSYPIFDQGHMMGAMVLKRDMSRLDGWNGQTQAFLTDLNGVVILAQVKELEGHYLPRAPAASMSPLKLQQLYRRQSLTELQLQPWNERRFTGAVLIQGQMPPVTIAQALLARDSITVHTPRTLENLVRFDTEKVWLFLLLSISGAMVIVTVYVIMMRLRESRRLTADLRISAIAFEVQEGIAITDAHCRVVRVNKAFTKITGYGQADIVGQAISTLQSGRHDAEFYHAMWEHLNESGSWEGEIWNKRKNGEIFPEYLTITAVKDDDGSVANYVGSFTDISVTKAAAEEIERLAFFDPLTQLPNRRLLMDRLQQALASSARSRREGALLFIDLDNFKTLNDTLGHDVGDLLLQQVAQRLLAGVREGDTVARLGGDEFVVMLEGLSSNPQDAATETKTVGAKILQVLNEPYQLGQHSCASTPSIGAVLFGGRHEAVDELVKQADIAMYQAKKAGRNNLRFFDLDMQVVLNARADLETGLRNALELGQLRLYYQIQVDHGGRALGAEALLRWQHPERGLVSPLAFIGLAEETGLIVPIGNWVLQTACEQLQRWKQQAQTRDLTLAINVSARQFRQPDFVEQVRQAVQRYAVLPGHLKIELTESLLADNLAEMVVTMRALKDCGVGISLDDFGTGYSSLQYLKQLPLDQLKIDKSFVQDLAQDGNDRAIVRTIIAMARSLNLDVIAEGVETQDQQDLLANKGCLHFQGYLFGQPEPIETFLLHLQQFLPETKA